MPIPLHELFYFLIIGLGLNACVCFVVVLLIAVFYFTLFSCKEPVEPLTLEEVAERCHAPEDVCTKYCLGALLATCTIKHNC